MCVRVPAHEVMCSVCVCVCVCVSAPDQPLIAIFSPVEVGGSHLAPWWEKGRIWILRVRGRRGEGQAIKDDDC